jgi:hypothetical protein
VGHCLLERHVEVDRLGPTRSEMGADRGCAEQRAAEIADRNDRR